jgi:hypothetical protein
VDESKVWNAVEVVWRGEQGVERGILMVCWDLWVSRNDPNLHADLFIAGGDEEIDAKGLDPFSGIAVCSTPASTEPEARSQPSLSDSLCRFTDH